MPTRLDVDAEGRALHAAIAELFPICRSITGDGVRETLAAVGKRLPLEVSEVPTGTPVLDWEIPREWEVRGARITGPDGRVVADFADSNLHLVGYSAPVRTRVPLVELREHLVTLPDRPDAVPYRTSYWNETWGFCVSQRVADSLVPGDYDVVVDTTLAPGHLTYGEVVLEGETDDEVLLSTHVCHPSMANDNLSGITVLTRLGELLAADRRRYTYRLLFVPGTIGSISWLAHNREVVGRIRHGVVLTGLGDPGPLTWKRSRRGDTVVDRAAAVVLGELEPESRVVAFSPYGYDERQYCSPGFDLPVGRLSRTPHGEYPEYHTSMDDLGFVVPGQLGRSLAAVFAIVDALEGDGVYRNTEPYGEPQLGRRGLYRQLGGGLDSSSVEMALLWVLNQSDGTASLLDIAERSGLDFAAVRSAADALEAAGLLVER